jgi:hypothetical protein
VSDDEKVGLVTATEKSTARTTDAQPESSPACEKCGSPLARAEKLAGPYCANPECSRRGAVILPPLDLSLREGSIQSMSREPRVRDGQALHDGGIFAPIGCPRGLGSQCGPLSRIASLGFESFMCCGQTHSAPVPTDRLRLCIKSTHETGVDLLVNLDERDAVHTASVLMGGLSALGSVKITATDSEAA